MIKASYRKNPSVLAGLCAAEAWRGAAYVAKNYEISNKQDLVSFYRESMRNWALHAIKLHKILTRHD